MGILNKLHRIQIELNVPKKQFNEYGKYNFRSCEDILEAVKPLLDKYKCALILKDELVKVGDRYYVEATATIYDTEDGKENLYMGGSISNKAYAREPEDKKGTDASQITGAASSYARKYSLAGLLLLDDVKDADATNKHGKDEPVPQAPAEQAAPAPAPAEKKIITEAQVKSLIKKCEKEEVPVEKICRLYKVKALPALTEKQYNNIIKFWEKVKGAE
jgi:hypothetical protein